MTLDDIVIPGYEVIEPNHEYHDDFGNRILLNIYDNTCDWDAVVAHIQERALRLVQQPRKKLRDISFIETLDGVEILLAGLPDSALIGIAYGHDEEMEHLAEHRPIAYLFSATLSSMQGDDYIDMFELIAPLPRFPLESAADYASEFAIRTSKEYEVLVSQGRTLTSEFSELIAKGLDIPDSVDKVNRVPLIRSLFEVEEYAGTVMTNLHRCYHSAVRTIEIRPKPGQDFIDFGDGETVN